MAFSPLLVTSQGLNALAEIPTGATLTITKVEAGSGYPVTGDVPANFTALKAYVMDADSTSTNTAVLYQSTIRCNLTSKNAPKVFQVNEFGVFASLNNQAPFLFAYTSTGAPTGDTIDPAAPIVKEYVLPIVYATTQQVTTSITMTDVVGLHGSTHLPSGIDPLPIASSSIGGLTPKTPSDPTQILLGEPIASWGPMPLHGPTHISTGRDPVPISTPQATGLLPALSGNINDVLRGDGTWGAGFFSGCILDYAGFAVPAGWLLCDGQAYSRSVYWSLYVALGGSISPWGQGDGSSTFNVPDFRGRTTIGAGQGAGLSNRALGTRAGEETHTLALAEMPAHNHGVNDPTHAHAVYDPGHAHSVYDPSHAHGVYDPGHAHSYTAMDMAINYGSGAENGDDTRNYGRTTSVNVTNIGIYAAYTNIALYLAGTNISLYASGTGISIQYAGGSGAHNNMQPYAVVNKIIHT
jgi:microcystin-dependent protein